jgi:flavin-dependent dehydrogenase
LLKPEGRPVKLPDMKKGKDMLKGLLCGCLAVVAAEAGAATVTESAKELPLVQDVDVVVVGGSSGAVAAAKKAAECGAKVFVAAPRPYLGEDMAGKMRLRLTEGDDTRCELQRAMFSGDEEFPPSLPFSYMVDAKADPHHADPANGKLGDGKYADAPADSVQFNGDVTFTLDLGQPINLSMVRVATFERDAGENNPDSFKTSAIAADGSADKKTWTALGGIEGSRPGKSFETASLELPVKGAWRYLRVRAQMAPTVKRQLLGEILVYPAKDSATAAAMGDRTTPLKVKKTLDAALLKAGVPFLTGSQVCGTVTDAGGALAGVVLVNRNGRQVVKAKVVIDATERGLAARAAGAKATPFPAGNYAFKRVVVAGEAPHGEGVKAHELFGLYPAKVTGIKPPKGVEDSVDGRMFLCEIDLPMKDGSARSFAEAEQKARDLTFVPSQLDSADTLDFNPPDWIRGKASSKAAWQGVDTVDLRVLQPEGTEWLFVLSAMADVSRDAAEALARPGNLMALGERVGAEAARLAKARPAIGAVTAGTGMAGAAADNGSVREADKGLPKYLTNASGTVKAKAEELPVLASCEVFVVGAGTGGAPAAIAASRAGMKTIVCDYLYQMGGVETDGLIGIYCFGNRVGFTTEIDAGVKATGTVFNQCKSEWFRRENRKAGAEVWYGTVAEGVVVENNHLTGVVVVMPDGQRGVVRCKVAIDATGNAVLPALAGEETEYITAAELAVQGVGMTPRNMGANYTNTDIGFVDDTDAADLCFFALRSRVSIGAGVWDQAQGVNSRERRRMIGAFYMSPLDVTNQRTYPDTVVQTFSNFDTHGQTVHEEFFIDDPGHAGMRVNLPYRCFLPKKLDGLLVTGLGISAHRDAMPILRMQPDVQNQGFVAGTAAALAIKAGVEARDVDIKALQKILIEEKIVPASVLEMKDSYPYPDAALAEAVGTMTNKYRGLSIAMTDAKRSIPMLRKAFRGAADADAKLIYAHVLGMMGERDGEDVLIEKVKVTPWDKGWNFRGMGQFNRSVSWVDSYIIALGRCKSAKAVPAIIAKTGELTDKSEYSHFRAVAMALEAIGDKSAAPALAKALKVPGLAGHAIKMSAELPVYKNYSNTEGDWERTLCLREISLGRALYNLGDVSGLGRATMEAYANDPRGAYAAHAKLVLKE